MMFKHVSREFEILEVLSEHRGDSVSREQLIARIWGTSDEVDVSTRTVDHHIAALRRKLDVSTVSSPIETIYGFRYRLSS
ncbi:MAG: winged helix-turn-helix domain-containing protein [Acidobacteriota bacterium]